MTASEPLEALPDLTLAEAGDRWGVSSRNSIKAGAAALGVELRRESGTRTVWLLLFLSLVLVAGCSKSNQSIDEFNASMADENKKELDNAPPFAISLEQFNKELERNVVATQLKYRGKSVAIAGVITYMSAYDISNTSGVTVRRFDGQEILCLRIPREDLLSIEIGKSVVKAFGVVSDITFSAPPYEVVLAPCRIFSSQ